MPTYPLPSNSHWCNDEDLAVRALADLDDLVPRHQSIAAGTDGVIAAGAWTLSSATVNFSDRGVAQGHVVDLWGNSGTHAADRFGTESRTYWMAVESANGAILTLRRVGLAAGVGEPAGTTAAITAVKFSIPTLTPQIERASRQLNHRFEIDASRVGRAPGDLYDPDDLREACEALTLRELYLAHARQATNDAWKMKAELYGQEFEAALARLSVRFGSDVATAETVMRVGRVGR